MKCQVNIEICRRLLGRYPQKDFCDICEGALLRDYFNIEGED